MNFLKEANVSGYHAGRLRAIWRLEDLRNSIRLSFDSAGSQVRGRQLVNNPVSIGVDIQPEAFFGLHPVVMIESVAAELPQRNDVANLVQRTNDEAWRSRAFGGQARGGQALDLGRLLDFLHLQTLLP